MADNKTIQLQYNGYYNTPALWLKKSILQLNQFELKNSELTLIEPISRKIPLGKLVEYFIFEEFKNNENIKIICTNLQIIEGKVTLGELDLIIEKDNQLIHLEIVYKYYLYNKEGGNDEINRWVGPNKNDKLAFKLDKLRNKQLPLLHKKQTAKKLKEIGVNTSKIRQKVIFKAQLFIQYNTTYIDSEIVNKDCLKGYYIKIADIHQLNDCMFFIPSKLEWLIEAHQNVDWIGFNELNHKVNSLFHNEKSPLCWVKQPNNTLDKVFIVWW